MKDLKWIGVILAGVCVIVACVAAKQSKTKMKKSTKGTTTTNNNTNVAPQEQRVTNETQALENIKSDVVSSIKEKHDFAHDIIQESVSNIVNEHHETVDDSEFDEMNEKIHTILGM